MNLPPSRAFQPARDGRATIIDICEPHGWRETGAPPGTLLVPQAALEAEGRPLGRGPIILTCRTGSRSRETPKTLAERGLNVFEIAGGIEAWLSAGLPLTSPAAGRRRL